MRACTLTGCRAEAQRGHFIFLCVFCMSVCIPRTKQDHLPALSLLKVRGCSRCIPPPASLVAKTPTRAIYSFAYPHFLPLLSPTITIAGVVGVRCRCQRCRDARGGCLRHSASGGAPLDGETSGHQDDAEKVPLVGRREGWRGTRDRDPEGENACSSFLLVGHHV